MCILAHNTQMFVHPCMRVMLKHKKKKTKKNELTTLMKGAAGIGLLWNT